MTTAPHIPVLLDQVIIALALTPDSRGHYIDGTFGAGGYSRRMLDTAPINVHAIDRDPNVGPIATKISHDFPGRFSLLAGCFGDLADLLPTALHGQINGICFDFGVSSMQLDQAERGFSFRQDGPLDMRMGQDGPSAADLVNSMDETTLADIIYHYGEEKLSRRIARAIVEKRRVTPFVTTLQLADTVRAVVPRSRDGIDPATRTFQALRIAVNDELGEIERGLSAAERVLAPGGRLAAVSFHSLEDRIVKNFLASRSGKPAQPVNRHIPDVAGTAPAPTFRIISRKPVVPDDNEQHINPRARSARLRIAERTDAPSWEKAA